MFNNYICALDIGASKISAVAAKIKGKRIVNIFFDTLPSGSIKKGVVIDSVALTDSVSRVLKNLKAKSGINIKFIYINISGRDIITKHSRAIMPLVERGNKIITAQDIQRINEQARILGSSLEEEILHQLPFSYAIDSKDCVLNPLGLYSHRLEVDAYLICARLSSLQNITRAISQAGYETEGLFFSGMATALAVLNKELREGANVICDVGRDVTELLLFRDGTLKGIEVLFLGGDNLTAQIHEGLKIPFDLAEDIKRSYGIIGDYTHIREDKEVLIKRNDIYQPIKQRLVAEILTSAAKSSCWAIKEALAKLAVPTEVDNIIVVGRSVLLDGFLETLESSLGIPVRLGRISNPDMITQLKKEDALAGQKYLTYVTALGLICMAQQQQEASCLSQPPRNPIFRTLNKFKEIYQEYF